MDACRKERRLAKVALFQVGCFSIFMVSGDVLETDKQGRTRSQYR